MKLCAKIAAHFLFDVGVILVIMVDCALYFAKAPPVFSWH